MGLPLKSVATASAAALILSAPGAPSQALAQVLAEGRAIQVRPVAFRIPNLRSSANLSGFANGLAAFSGLVPASSLPLAGARVILPPAQPALSVAAAQPAASAAVEAGFASAPGPPGVFSQAQPSAGLEARFASLDKAVQALGEAPVGRRDLGVVRSRLGALYDGAALSAALAASSAGILTTSSGLRSGALALRTEDSRVRPQGLAAPAKDTPDESAQLEQLIQWARDGVLGPIPEAARRGVRILLVPGLGWEVSGPIYFKPALEFLLSKGLDVKFVATDHIGTMVENAPKIAAAIMASDKPVMIIGHSKGGMDALKALLDFPETQAKVWGYLAIQSPFFGTPYADWFRPRPWVFDLQAMFVKLFQYRRLSKMRPLGHHETVWELTEHRNAKLPRERPPLAPHIRLFSVTSQVGRVTAGNFLEWLRVQLKALPRQGSDGAVTKDGSLLPGSITALLDEVIHWETVTSHRDHRGIAALLSKNHRHLEFPEHFMEALVHWIFAREEPPRPAVQISGGPQQVERENLDFLAKVGFKSDREEIAAQLTRADLEPAQREVLERALEQTPALDSAGELAAKVMRGLAEQGFSEEALDKAADLAARLLALKPIKPPSALPPELASSADKEKRLDSLTDATDARMKRHLRGVVSDVLDTIYGPQDPRRLGPPSEEVASVQKLVWDILLAKYADPDINANQHAGRALAAVLVRHARRHQPEFERVLQDKLKERGLKLSDYIGDTLELTDRYGETHRFKFETGDYVAHRSNNLAAMEIAAGVRPPLRLWWKAWRQRLLGPVVGIWIYVSREPTVVPGQRVRNGLRRWIYKARKWLSSLRIFLRGYSHTGEVVKKEADRVAVLRVAEERMNSRKGGISQVALRHEFIKDTHVRFGWARLHPKRTAREFLRQAKRAERKGYKNGYRQFPFEAVDGAWPNGLSPENYEKLKALARRDPEKFLEVANRRAVLEGQNLRLRGTGYDHAWLNKLWLASCSSFIYLIHMLGNLLDVEPLQGMWHPLVWILQKAGLSNAKGLDLSVRIIGPGNLFLQPIIDQHRFVELPVRAYDLEADTVEDYHERNPALTQALGELAVDRSSLRRVLAANFLALDKKRIGAKGWQEANLSGVTGYFGALDRLWALPAAQPPEIAGSSRIPRLAWWERGVGRLLGLLHALGWLGPLIRRVLLPILGRAQAERRIVSAIASELWLGGFLPGIPAQPSWEALTARHLGLLDQSRFPPRKAGEPSLLLEPGFVQELEALAGARFAPGNKVVPLSDGPAIFPMREKLMLSARRSIHLMDWELRDDRTGNETADLLIAKHRAGVEVKVLVDEPTRLSGEGEGVLRRLVQAGVAVVRFSDPHRPYDGMHMKGLLVDGEAAIVGGTNVGDVYSHKDPKGQKWRDTDLLIRGPVVAQLRRLFRQVWNSQVRERGLPLSLIPEDDSPLAELGATPMVLSYQGPGNESRALLTYLKAIRGATRRVNISHGYLVTFPALRQVLLEALARGVEVNILTNSIASMEEPSDAVPILESLPELIRAGAKVYLKQGDMLHNKVMTVDGIFSTAGSFNLYLRSIRLEWELTVSALDPALAAELDEAFARDLAQARFVQDPDELHVPSGLMQRIEGRYFHNQR